MKRRGAAVVRLAEPIGTAMWIAWAIFLGPGGFLLLLGVAYSMYVQNLALGIVCGMLLFSPLALIVLWAPLGWFAVLYERRALRSRGQVSEAEVKSIA
jgi:hypothetical protein